MSRIAKIKFKDGVVHILDISGQGSSNEIETTHRIFTEPHPDFKNAMSALVEHVRTILEWPVSYAIGAIRIGGVSFSMSEDSGVEGAVISGLVDLKTSQSPFTFNTPHLPFDQYNEGGTAPVMPDDAIEALEELRREARAFLKGKRTQGDLFATDADQPAPAH
ncbi:MAG: hypothetical protein HOO99_04010 [Hyphomicrobiaceae bacterium]|nr:hypothetical protein [Hyphomicrobiaceae bacterium]